MIDLKKFRRVNSLIQQAVADYLGTSREFISLVESGKAPLPYNQYCKLRDNTMGWDTSMLQENETGDNIIVNNSENCIGKIAGEAEVVMLRRENEMLRQQIEELKAEKAEYWETIKRLTTLNHIS